MDEKRLKRALKKIEQDKEKEWSTQNKEWESGELVIDPTDHLDVARRLLGVKFVKRAMRTLHRHRGVFWRWTGSYFRDADDEDIKAVIWQFLDRTKREKEVKVEGGGTEVKKVRVRPNKPHVENVLAALGSETALDKTTSPPTWVKAEDDEPEPREILSCGNGLLHIPTGKLLRPTPTFFCLAATEVDYDPEAAEPALWLAFLEQLWGDDTQSIELLQEWFGYVLSADTSLQKILLMVGATGSGKGTIARVLSALLGRQSVGGPSMDDLGERFGLEPLITKPLAIVADARFDGLNSKVTARLLNISGEDRITTDRKNKLAWTGTLPTRMMILTNDLPNLRDASGALARRFITLVLEKSFEGKEDQKLTEKLLNELPGILNWAIEGYKRLQERGAFARPDSAQEAAEGMERLSRPVKTFVRECCEVKSGLEVSTDDLWEVYQTWRLEQGARDAGMKPWFSRDLYAAVPGIKPKKGREGNDRYRAYVGIGLSAEWYEPNGNGGVMLKRSKLKTRAF
jgi:putative DNA primase/helicase